MSIKALQDYTYTSKYARYDFEKKRRETWDEAVNRVMDMHLRKYPQVEEEIRWAFEQVRKKRVLGSQRALQYGGAPIEKTNARIYNCVASYCDRVRFFQETLWLLLAGCGAGFSVQKHHVDKMPAFLPENFRNKEKKTFIVPDTIEGWANALGVLMATYLPHPNYPQWQGKKVEFDFSMVRQKGSYLSSGVGKAPGPEPLRRSLNIINSLLENRSEKYKKLRPIDAYDVVMHASDAVLSGGVRRCIAKGSRVITKNGFKYIENVEIGDLVSTINGWKAVKNVFNQGIQQTVEIKHQDGSFVCTPNHRVAVLTSANGDYVWKQANELKNEDRLFYVANTSDGSKTELPHYEYVLPEHSTTCKNIKIPKLDEDLAWFIGMFHGDGYVRLTTKSGEISVHGDDYAQSQKIQKIIKRFGVNARIQEPREDFCFKVRAKSKQLADFISKHIKQPKKPLIIPECIINGEPRIKISYLQGVLDSDGSVKNRPQQIVTTVYKKWAKDIQSLLYSLGICSRFKKLTPPVDCNWQQKYSISLINNYDKNLFNEYSQDIGFKKFTVNKSCKFANSYPQQFFENYKPKGWSKYFSSNSKEVTSDSLSRLVKTREIVPIKIKQVIQSGVLPTYDIEVEDNHCFVCEGVLVHNSATICLFSPDDEDMASAKTGNWFNENPQRARSNNSALLIRDETSKEQFFNLMKHVKEFGEPGFIWSDSKECLFNPCCEIALYGYDSQGNSGWQSCNLTEINGKKCVDAESFELAAKAASIIGTLQAGYTDFEYLGNVTERIVRKESLLGVSITGIQDVPEILLDPALQRKMAKVVIEVNEVMAAKIGINPAARCTTVKPAGCRPINALTATDKGILTLKELLENHDIRNQWDTPTSEINTNGGKISKTFFNGYSDTVKVCLKHGIEMTCTPNHQWFVKYRIDRRKKENKVEVNNWVCAEDLQFGDVLDIDLKSYRRDFHSPLRQEYRLKAFDKHNYNCNDISQPTELNPEISWLLGYLWGDGTMKLSKFRLSFIDEHLYNLEKVQNILLSTFGIKSNIFPSKNKNSFELEIGNKFLWHWLIVNEIYKYDDDEISIIPRVVRESGHEDIIAFIAGLIDSDGHVGMREGNHIFRNQMIFTTPNDNFADHFQHVAMSVGLVFSKSLNTKGENYQKDKRMWLMNLSSHVDPASFLLLSKYSNKVIHKENKDFLWKHEADSANTGILGKVHEVKPNEKKYTFDIETTEHWFMAGAIKSHNSTSCVLGSASGIHPHHARKYFRRVQANVLEAPLQFFKKSNPRAIEPSVWSANNSDEIITFLIDVPKGARVKNDLPALELLEMVKTTQQNWVTGGKVEERCVQKWLNHNVSNTVNVLPEEWDAVAEYIYKNRKHFAGISLLPSSGDLDYPQAPMVRVRNHKEIAAVYGIGSSFASGLIVDGLRAFNNDLWKACSSCLNPELVEKPDTSCCDKLEDIININHIEKHAVDTALYLSKQDWIRRARQFAERYFENNIRLMTYCLKDVHNWKLWNDLEREYKDVDYSNLIEEENNVKINETIACAGGACELVY